MEEFLSKSVSLQQEAANEKTTGDRLTELAKLSTELAQRVAQNPSTPPQLLRKLANRNDATIRKNVVANPNTPTEVLLELGAQFPNQLLDNPIFSLLLLENPNLVEQIPLTTLRSLLKCETVPVSFLEWAGNYAANNRERGRLHLAVAMNVRTPRKVLEKLALSKDTWVAEAVRLHVNLAGEMTRRWNQAACEAIKTTDFCEANAPAHLANSTLSCLERRGFIPEFVIEQLARHQHGNIRSFVADKLSTSVKLLEQLAQDKDSSVRASVARNPNTPIKFLKKLAQDGVSHVRRNVAQNPNTPIKFLQQLTQDKDDDVRKLVAKNPNAPVQLLEQFAQDRDYVVRKLVAENPNTPVKLLKQLALDRNNDVRDSVAANPNTPVKLLEQFAIDRNKFLRGHVAKNPNTPLYLLEQLAHDERYVRQHVAANPNTSVKLLEQLAQDKDHHVRGFIVQNPNTPVNVFLELILKNYSQDSIPSLSRFLVLLHPQTQGLTLAENCSSNAWLDRYAIAQHPNTPLHTLHTLAVDANRIVRATAKANLHAP
ncbi:MAG: HEAT repeat domain-containing protein [Cyanobacteriota bacterium]